MKNLKSIKKALFVAFSSLALAAGLIAAPFSAFAQDYNRGGNKSDQRDNRGDNHRDSRGDRRGEHRDNRDRNQERRDSDRHERERRDRDRHERERRDRDRHERERRDRDDRHRHRRHREFREDDRFIVINGLRYYVLHDGRGPYIRYRGMRYYLEGDTVVVRGIRYDVMRD